MTGHLSPPEEQARALIDEIEAQAAARRAAVLDAARAETATILGAAHREARGRMRELVQRLRRDRELALHQFRSRLNLDRRRREQLQAARLMDLGRSRLEAALIARWNKAAQRATWIDATLRQAARYFPSRPWQIAHPAALDAAEAAALLEVAGRLAGAPVEPVADQEIAAGLRIASDGAVLDATPKGLLADPYELNAALLAEQTTLRGADQGGDA